MKFNEKDLMLACQRGIITTQQFTSLILLFNELYAEDIKKEKQYVAEQNSIQDTSNKSCKQEEKSTKSGFEKLMYYFGGVLIIISLGWFIALSINSFGMSGLLVVCIVYFILFTFLGNILWKQDKKIPAGILYTCATATVPAAVWALEKITGMLPSANNYSGFHIWIRSCWIFMEIATITAASIFLKYRPYPFLTLPLCYSLWYLSMDVVPLLIGHFDEPTWAMRNYSTLFFSVLMLIVAKVYDNIHKKDFSHWFYIFGATMFWCAVLSIIYQLKINNEFTSLIFALFSFAYMIISVIIERNVFMIWGSIGVLGYVFHLGYVVFKDTPLFPFILILFGLSVILLGLKRNEIYEFIVKLIKKIIKIN